jgi:hypothetical protein
MLGFGKAVERRPGKWAAVCLLRRWGQIQGEKGRPRFFMAANYAVAGLDTPAHLFNFRTVFCAGSLLPKPSIWLEARLGYHPPPLGFYGVLRLRGKFGGRPTRLGSYKIQKSTTCGIGLVASGSL